MPDTRYIRQIKKGWYICVAIPRPLRHFFNRKSHVIYTLKTKELPVAQQRRWVELAKIRARFEAAKEAKEDHEKFEQEELKIAAMDWQKKISATGFRANIDEFHAAKDKVFKTHGTKGLGEFVQISMGKAGKPLDFLEAEFFAERKITPRTQSHYRKTRRALEEFLQHEGLPATLESVTRPVALAYQSWLVANDFHPVTGNAYLGGLRSRFNFLIAKMAVEGPNPFQSVVLKAANTGEEESRRPWTGPELKRLFSADGDLELYELMAAGLLLGARRAEVVGFKVKDYRSGWLYVRTAKSKAGIRKIPCPRVLRLRIRELIAGKTPSDYIFLQSKSDVALHTRGNLCGQRFERFRKGIGLGEDSTVYHSLRHSYMTLADESRPRHHVRVVVGHSDKKDTTSGYTKVSDRNRVRVMQAVVKGIPSEVRRNIAARLEA